MSSTQNLPAVGAIALHADDFGMNRAVNEGVIRGFTHGLLTSTSLLANSPVAGEALRSWRALCGHAIEALPSAAARRALGELRRPFELGIHLNLTQGRPVTGAYPSELLDNDGRFPGIVHLFRHLHRRQPRWESAICAELSTQIEFLVDHGQTPTHLNGHQYIELMPGLQEIVRQLAARYAIRSIRVARESGLLGTTLIDGLAVGNVFSAAQWPVARFKRFYAERLMKSVRGWNADHADAYFGTSHAGRIDLALFRRFLDLGRGRPLIEIGLHPATACDHESTHRDDPSGWHDPLAGGRPAELELLTSPELVELLCSFQRSLGRLASAVSKGAARAA